MYYNIGGENIVNGEKVLLKDLLIFVTGTDRIPPGGFHHVPEIWFLHKSVDVLCTSSTCDLVLRIPVLFHCNEEKFQEMMTLSLKGYIIGLTGTLVNSVHACIPL